MDSRWVRRVRIFVFLKGESEFLRKRGKGKGEGFAHSVWTRSRSVRISVGWG